LPVFRHQQENFVDWKQAYAEKCEVGLINSNPCPEYQTLRTPPEIEEKILCLRKNYHLCQMRLAWYLKRYYASIISSGGFYHVLKRHGMSRLPRYAKKRTLLTHRYEKQVPGHHI
jgi:hypothetical protein